MDWNTIAGNWEFAKAEVQKKWHFLSDRDLDEIDGRWGQLLAKIEARYGLAPGNVRQWAQNFVSGKDFLGVRTEQPWRELTSCRARVPEMSSSVSGATVRLV